MNLNQQIEGESSPSIDPQSIACLNLWLEVFKLGLMDSADSFKKTRQVPFWITDDYCAPGTFVWLCDMFNVSPDAMRSKWRSNLRALVKDTKHDPAFKNEVRTEMDEVALTDPLETSSSHSPVCDRIQWGDDNRQPQRANQGDGR